MSKNIHGIVIFEFTNDVQIQTVVKLLDEHKNVPVLIWSDLDEDVYGVKCLIAGAKGFISKDTARSELLSAVRIVSSKKLYLTPGLFERHFDTVACFH